MVTSSTTCSHTRVRIDFISDPCVFYARLLYCTYLWTERCALLGVPHASTIIEQRQLTIYCSTGLSLPPLGQEATPHPWQSPINTATHMQSGVMVAQWYVRVCAHIRNMCACALCVVGRQQHTDSCKGCLSRLMKFETRWNSYTALQRERTVEYCATSACIIPRGLLHKQIKSKEFQMLHAISHRYVMLSARELPFQGARENAGVWINNFFPPAQPTLSSSRD